MVASGTPFEPFQVAQAATGTMTDAGGGQSGGSQARTTRPQQQAKPRPGLGRRGGPFGRTLPIEIMDVLYPSGLGRTLTSSTI